jgi:hypothetical protein
MRKLLVMPVALAALPLASIAFARPVAAPKLQGTVGPGFSIVLKQAGTKVTKLKAGTYLFVVSDKSAIHSFVLEKVKGGTFEKDVTSVPFVGTKSVTIKLTTGKWKYYCSAHPTTMLGFFTVT